MATTNGEGLDFSATVELLRQDIQPTISLETMTMGNIGVQIFDSLSFDESTEILVGRVQSQTPNTPPSETLRQSLAHASEQETELLVLIYPDGQCTFILENELNSPA